MAGWARHPSVVLDRMLAPNLPPCRPVLAPETQVRSSAVRRPRDVAGRRHPYPVVSPLSAAFLPAVQSVLLAWPVSVFLPEQAAEPWWGPLPPMPTCLPLACFHCSCSPLCRPAPSPPAALLHDPPNMTTLLLLCVFLTEREVRDSFEMKFASMHCKVPKRYTEGGAGGGRR